MASNKDNRNKFLSALITLLLGAGLVALLLFTSLHYEYPPKDAQLQQLLQDSIVFGGDEYVALGDLLEPIPDQDLAENGEENPLESESQETEQQEVGQNDLMDQGSVDETPRQQVATKTQESPMKVKEQPPKKKSAEKNTETPAVKPRKQGDVKEQTSQKPTQNKPTAPSSAVNNRVKNAFGKNNGTGGGKQGSPSGSANGSTVGRPGVGGLEGYTLEYFPTQKVPSAGTVVIRVTVSPTGAVSKANIAGGSVSDSRTRNICLSLAKKSRFRVPKGQNIERSGTLTYTIR